MGRLSSMKTGKYIVRGGEREKERMSKQGREGEIDIIILFFL